MLSKHNNSVLLGLVIALVIISVSSANSINVSCEQNDIISHYSNHPDRMHFMPGFNQPLPSNWFSGYLHYELEGRQVHTHYVLVLAEETAESDDKENLPLIYWTNGGPGASSLYGLMTELGPLILSDLSVNTDDYKETGIPTPIYNSNSWTRLGSILIIDQPAPVGFSYCNDDVDSHSCGGIKWTDELASLNSYIALQTFFRTKFPCMKSKDLYLTGESYGGIYVPTLARRIIQDSSNNNINLKGFAVGDGCLGTHTSICGDLNDTGTSKDFWNLLFMAGHNQIPLKSFHQVMDACSHLMSPGLDSKSKEEDDNTCNEMLKKVKKEVGGFFVYSLYDDCTYRNGLLQLDGSNDKMIEGGLNDYPCGGGPVMENYLKMEAVKDALHVKSTFFEVDNAEGDFDYTPTEPDLTGFYKELINDNTKDIRVLIYNGDTDPAITSFAAQNWTSNMGFTETEEWRPWTIDGCQRMGGYVTRYENGMFDFVTIRGAGHMVPTYKPEATFSFLRSWIQGKDYPRFDVHSKHPTQTRSIRNKADEKKDKGSNAIHQNDRGSSAMLRTKQ